MNTALSKIDSLRADLSRRFLERGHVIDGCLAAVLAGEHVLLIGPPGTAKSALVRALAQSFGGTYFERLLTKFSTPEEIFGPISLKALENDRFERVIAGKLPDVQFGFVDEVFKSSSAILNSLLTLMNERLYHNDGAPIHCPLVTLFGASNELPESGDLDALFDRFLLRFDVQYLENNESLRSIFTADASAPVQMLTMEELREAQAEAATVEISAETIDGIIAVRAACAAEGIVASDRRWKQCLRVAKANAYLAGRNETAPDDLHVLRDMLWREPKEYKRVARLVSDHADPVMASVREILAAVSETTKRLHQTIATLQPANVNQAAIHRSVDHVVKKYTEQKAQLSDIAARSSARARRAIEGAVTIVDKEITAAAARRR